MLAGAVATTAVAAVGASDIPAMRSTPPIRIRSQDMMAFLVLSAALTGVQIINLAPEFATDKDD